MLPITRNRALASASTAAIGHIVYESAADTVAFSITPASQRPFGVVKSVDEDAGRVDVVILGEAMVRVGTGGLTAGTHTVVVAENNATASLDGRAIAPSATAGVYWTAGFVTDLVANAAANDFVKMFVCPSQITVSE